MKKMIKRIFFVAIIVSLILATGIVIKTGKFSKLEGYMYSFAMDITNTATDGNATSCDATSSNATSSNATSGNATSSNATSSDATSNNATSSNITTETIKVTNTQPNTNTQTNINTQLNTNTQTNTNTKPNTSKVEEEKEYTVTTTTGVEEDNEVSFLESHKMYIIIIGMSVLSIIIVWVIIVVDKKAIAKRKAKANNENKIN